MAVLLLVTCDPSLATPMPVKPDLPWLMDVWETDDGLPQNSVLSIAQTPDGFLWLATFEGLARFDGVTFRRFDQLNTPGLASKAIRALHVDGRGNLWIGTDCSVTRLDRDGWHSYGESNGWPARPVESMAEDADGQLVASAQGDSLYRFDGERFIKMPRPDGSAPGMSLGVARDANKRLWAWSSNCLARWETNGWVEVLRPEDFSSGGLLAVGPSKDGGLWLSDRMRLRKFKDGEWAGNWAHTATNLPQPDLRRVLEDSRGNVWEASLLNGLWLHETNGTTVNIHRRTGRAHSLVRTVFEDREGNIWVGRGGGGLVRLKPRAVFTWSDDDGLPVGIIKSVTIDSNAVIWVGTHGGSVAKFDGTKFDRVPVQRGKATPLSIWSILADRRGRLWVGTYGNGLYRLKGGVLSPVEELGRRSTETVHALFEDRDGMLWAGSERGVIREIESDPLKFERYGTNDGLPACNMVCVAQSSDGKIVVGSSGGGAYVFNGERFERFASREELDSDEVWSLMADQDGTIWIGSNKGGLSRYRDGKFVRFNPANGLPANSIGSIIDDHNGHLWLGTDRGIMRVLRSDLEAVASGTRPRLRPLVFNRSDGMESGECAGGYQPTVARDSAGRFWFATLKGLSQIDPARLPHNGVPPQVLITGVRVDGREMLLGRFPGDTWRPGDEMLRLPADTRHIEVDYTATSLTAPEKVQFETVVAGRDREWNQVGSRRTAYPPARNRPLSLVVRACNNDGVWSDDSTALLFVVTPYLWQTWWFRAAAGGAMLALVGLAGWMVSRRSMRRRVSALEREKQLAFIKARLASVLENTSDFVSYTDPQGRLLYINQAGRKMIGLSPDTDVSHRNLREMHPAWAAKKILDDGMPEAAQRGSWHGETALWNPNGYEIPVSQVTLAHRESDGTLSFFSTVARDIGEAKKAEQSLRDREERFRMAAEQTGQLVYDYSIPTGLIRWLGAIEAVTGYTPEEFNSLMDLRGWTEQIHPDDRENALAQLDIAVRDGTPYDVQYRFRRKDGTYFFARDNGVFQRDAGGRSMRMLGAMQDITQFRRADEARELLRRVAQALTGPLTTREIGLLLARECRGLFHHDAFFVDLNDESTKLRSSVYCEDTPLGANDPCEVPSSFSAGTSANLRTMFQGEPVLLNRLEASADGEATTWGFKDRLSRSLMLVPIRWEGHCIGVLSVQSYTPGRYSQKDLELLQALADHCGAAVARAEADAALRAERNFIATLLDTVGSLVIVLDREGRVIRFNEACVKTSGYAAAEVLGRESWDLLVAPEDRDRVRKIFGRLIAGEYPLRDENNWMTHNGPRRRIAWDNTVLLDKDGKVQYVIATGMDITDRVTAEEALRETEQRFELAVRGSSDGLWDRNLLTEDVFYSDRYKEQLGYAPDEFPDTYESFLSHLHPEDRAAVEAAQRAHLQDQLPYDIELRMRTKFGTYRWFRSRAQAIRDESGRPVRMAGAHTDITNSKQAEEALRQGEALLTQTNRIAQVGGWELDVVTRQFTWTPELYHLHEVVAGFTPTIEESFNFFVPASRETVRQAFEQCLRDGRPWDLEVEFVTAAGRRLWIHTQGEAQYEHGKVRRIVGALQDITRRKSAEESLRAVAVGTAGVSGGDFFRSLVRHLALALRVRHAFIGELLGAEAKRVRILSAWSGGCPGEPFEYDLAGTPCAEAVGKSMCFYPHSIREAFPADPMLRSMNAEGYIGAPLLNSEKKLIGLLAVVHDRPLPEGDDCRSIVTVFAARAGAELERIHAEQHIHRLNAELERRVQERTAQLVAANQEMQAFSYSVSHDLRAPLRHVAGFTKLLERNPAVVANPEAQRLALVVSEAARKMGQLIDDLLIFSRMGRQELKRKLIDTAQMVDACLRDLQPDMAGRRIEWKLGTLAPAMADPAMLRQVWLNLLGNAIKYSRCSDPAVIEIGCSENDDEVVFSVTDNGAGFDMQYSEKLFGVFQRLHRDEEFEGTGIGLANVRRIVHRHGGRTWATGVVNQGASFFFSLPKVPDEIDLGMLPSAIPAPPTDLD